MSPSAGIQKIELRLFFRHLDPATRFATQNTVVQYIRRAIEILTYSVAPRPFGGAVGRIGLWPGD